MGLIGKMIGGAIAANLLKRLENGARSVPEQIQYIPASQPDTMRTQPTRVGNGIVDRAGRFYRENPRLVHAIGSAALAIALARLAQRRRM
jgi:hypothetical protein